MSTDWSAHSFSDGEFLYDDYEEEEEEDSELMNVVSEEEFTEDSGASEDSEGSDNSRSDSRSVASLSDALLSESPYSSQEDEDKASEGYRSRKHPHRSKASSSLPPESVLSTQAHLDAAQEGEASGVCVAKTANERTGSSLSVSYKRQQRKMEDELIEQQKMWTSHIMKILQNPETFGELKQSIQFSENVFDAQINSALGTAERCYDENKEEEVVELMLGQLRRWRDGYLRRCEVIEREMRRIAVEVIITEWKVWNQQQQQADTAGMPGESAARSLQSLSPSQKEYQATTSHSATDSTSASYRYSSYASSFSPFSSTKSNKDSSETLELINALMFTLSPHRHFHRTHQENSSSSSTSMESRRSPLTLFYASSPADSPSIRLPSCLIRHRSSKVKLTSRPSTESTSPPVCTTINSTGLHSSESPNGSLFHSSIAQSPSRFPVVMQKVSMQMPEELNSSIKKMLHVLNRRLLRRYSYVLSVALSPICPHFCEHVYSTILRRRGSVRTTKWPTNAGQFEDVLSKDDALMRTVEDIKEKLRKREAALGGRKGKKEAKVKSNVSSNGGLNSENNGIESADSQWDNTLVPSNPMNINPPSTTSITVVVYVRESMTSEEKEILSVLETVWAEHPSADECEKEMRYRMRSLIPGLVEKRKERGANVIQAMKEMMEQEENKRKLEMEKNKENANEEMQAALQRQNMISQTEKSNSLFVVYSKPSVSFSTHSDLVNPSPVSLPPNSSSSSSSSISSQLGIPPPSSSSIPITSASNLLPSDQTIQQTSQAEEAIEEVAHTKTEDEKREEENLFREVMQFVRWVLSNDGQILMDVMERGNWQKEEGNTIADHKQLIMGSCRECIMCRCRKREWLKEQFQKRETLRLEVEKEESEMEQKSAENKGNLEESAAENGASDDSSRVKKEKQRKVKRLMKKIAYIDGLRSAGGAWCDTCCVSHLFVLNDSITLPIWLQTKTKMNLLQQETLRPHHRFVSVIECTPEEISLLTDLEAHSLSKAV